MRKVTDRDIAGWSTVHKKRSDFGTTNFTHTKIDNNVKILMDDAPSISNIRQNP